MPREGEGGRGDVVIYEIVNPSDPYTMKSDNELAARLACLFLGEGAYGLRNENDLSVGEIFLFGASKEGLDRTFGGDFDKAVEDNRADIVSALESVLIGGIGARQEAESAIEKMGPADAEKWLAERHDRRRSSMNNIGKRAAALAESLKETTPAKAEGMGR